MGKPCPYCGGRMLGKNPRRADCPTRDHVNPRANGGGATLIVCQRCNQDKGAMALADWSAWLVLVGDERAKHVAPLVAGLANGTLRITTAEEMVGVSLHRQGGLSAGIFA